MFDVWFIPTCVSCGKTFKIIMTNTQLTELLAGDKKVQDIFPTFTPAERELLISGICGECFDKMFSEDSDLVKRPDYCTQNDGDCVTCSLVSYGRDCMNNSI